MFFQNFQNKIQPMDITHGFITTHAISAYHFNEWFQLQSGVIGVKILLKGN
jgi:hypothetical protein